MYFRTFLSLIISLIVLETSSLAIVKKKKGGEGKKKEKEKRKGKEKVETSG